MHCCFLPPSPSLSLSLFSSAGHEGRSQPPHDLMGALEEREKAGLFPPGMKEFL